MRDPFLKRPGAQHEELAENTVRAETIIFRMGQTDTQPLVACRVVGDESKSSWDLAELNRRGDVFIDQFAADFIHWSGGSEGLEVCFAILLDDLVALPSYNIKISPENAMALNGIVTSELETSRSKLIINVHKKPDIAGLIPFQCSYLKDVCIVETGMMTSMSSWSNVDSISIPSRRENRAGSSDLLRDSSSGTS